MPAQTGMRQNNRKEFVRGKMYVNGIHVDLNAFLNDQILEIPEIERKGTIEILDLNNF